MKKTLVAASLALAATSVLADGWRFAPIFTDKDFKLAPTLALTANTVDPKESGADTMSGVGVDFNFNCGILQDPQNRMRTHINIHRADKDDVKATAFELSPRYTMPLGEGFSAGVGPSLGLFKVKDDVSGFSETYFGLGLAAGVNFRSGAFYAGADVRYHVTGEKSGFDYDHMTAGLKVGVNF
jgi:hypothetical protein